MSNLLDALFADAFKHLDEAEKAWFGPNEKQFYTAEELDDPNTVNEILDEYFPEEKDNE
ncbi:MAG: hypothetical protein J6S67_12290 [Methanobrevibacter sp.]|nr:hypothetical protein [Methanobrevibacter sp.]